MHNMRASIRKILAKSIVFFSIGNGLQKCRLGAAREGTAYKVKIMCGGKWCTLIYYTWCCDDGSLRYDLDVGKEELRQNEVILCRETARIKTGWFSRGQEKPDKAKLQKM